MNKFKDVFWGGMVADAASMGFHWLYEHDQIKAAGGDTPEFHNPDPSLYVDGWGSVCVHHGKKAGNITHYGDQLLVMLKALTKTMANLARLNTKKNSPVILVLEAAMSAISIGRLKLFCTT